jgi:hypothetical protein
MHGLTLYSAKELSNDPHLARPILSLSRSYLQEEDAGNQMLANPFATV